MPAYKQREILTSEGEAEPEVVEALRRAAVVTKRHAAVPRVVVPATATEHAVRPTIGTCGLGLRGAAILAIPITTPFPYTAAHIVEA